MKGDEGNVLVVDDNEVNRDLLARQLHRQRYGVSVFVDRFEVNFVLSVARIDACWTKKRPRDREQAYLQKLTEEQEKSKRLLPKEGTNG